MDAQSEVNNPGLSSNFESKTKESMLKELQDLKDMLEELYEKNVQLDEENLSLRKEVKQMKGQIGNVLQAMRILREDLKKAHEIIKQPRLKSKAEIVV